MCSIHVPSRPWIVCGVVPGRRSVPSGGLTCSHAYPLRWGDSYICGRPWLAMALPGQLCQRRYPSTPKGHELCLDLSESVRRSSRKKLFGRFSLRTHVKSSLPCVQYPIFPLIAFCQRLFQRAMRIFVD